MLTTTTHSRHHHAFEKSPNHMKNIDRKLQAMSHASKYLQKIYPLGIQRTSSNLSLSSLSLSQNSNDSSLSSSNSSWEPKVPLLYGGTFSPWGDVLVSLERRREDDKVSDYDVEGEEDDFDGSEPGSLHGCSWITKNSDEAYVQFHDECWGVPVYNDNASVLQFAAVSSSCLRCQGCSSTTTGLRYSREETCTGKRSPISTTTRWRRWTRESSPRSAATRSSSLPSAGSGASSRMPSAYRRRVLNLNGLHELFISSYTSST